MISNNTIYVLTGEVKEAIASNALISNSIGSCVVIVLYNKIRRYGLMAHIMLPGKAPDNRKNKKMRYTANALDFIFDRIAKNHLTVDNFQVALIGGASMIKNQIFNIGNENIISIKEFLSKKNINVCYQSLGGTNRRSVYLDLSLGKLEIIIGDNNKDVFIF
jgi:chemotaxis protein CheD